MTDATQEPQTPSPESEAPEGAPSPAIENFLNAVIELDQMPVGAFRDRALNALDVLFVSPRPDPAEQMMKTFAMYMSVVSPILQQYFEAQKSLYNPPPYTTPPFRPCGCRGASSAPPVIDPSDPFDRRSYGGMPGTMYGGPPPMPEEPVGTPVDASKPSLADLIGLTAEQKAQIEAMLTPEQQARIASFGIEL